MSQAADIRDPIDVGIDAPALPPLPPRWTSLAGAFAQSVKRNPERTAFADSTRESLTYGETLLRAAALAGFVDRVAGRARHVGIMVPPTVHGAVANVAVTLAGKIPVNLNYTASQSVVDSSIEQCAITHVLTSRRVLDKSKIQPSATLVFLEDVRKQLTRLDKLRAFAAARAPISLLPAVLPGLRGARLDEPATVIFTSGSTGDPKGVVLTHRNVLSNMLGIREHVHITEDDVLLGVLPFFHSFGFTVTLWTVLGLGIKGVYHFNPLDSRFVGQMCAEHKATVMAATPTFMRGYLSRCPAEQFASLRLLIVGAEKLKPELAAEIKEKFGVEPLEGYGCTETGPVVSVNLPFDVRLPDGRALRGNQLGTVGRPLPGTQVRTVDPETGDLLPPAREGLIEVKGPQVMAGYLNKPEETARVLRDGWYNTGDLGYLTPEGFLKITDRLNRFAKIGGEMVPHHAVESGLARCLCAAEGTIVVTSVPDPKRGERLVVVHTPLRAAPAEIHRQLLASDLPRLWIPGPDDFVQVDELPVLGTGKLDLRAIKVIAAEHSARRDRVS